MPERNRVKFVTIIDGEPVSNFSAHEFENRAGIVCVSRPLITGLELTRRDLNLPKLGYLFAASDEILIHVARYGGVRTDDDNIALADNLGWVDEGGRVSRDSRHLLKYGGVAADVYATHKWSELPVAHVVLFQIAGRYFDFVKIYDDHVHVDQREGGLLLRKG